MRPAVLIPDRKRVRDHRIDDIRHGHFVTLQQCISKASTSALSWLVSFVINAIIQRAGRFHLKSFLRFIAAGPHGARAVLDGRTRHNRARPLPPGYQRPVLNRV
jgi:hypothetical protein